MATRQQKPATPSPTVAEDQMEQFHLVLSEMKQGDVFSEISHYIYMGKSGNTYNFRSLKTNETVMLSGPYVTKFLVGADQYHKEVKVGKEDKRDGTPGIRTIFQNIYNSDVMMVAFRTQNEKTGPKKLEAERKAQLDAAIEKLEKATRARKSIKDEAIKLFKEIQQNPVVEIKEGDQRILRGYKVQFESRDGRYKCVDMDIPSNENQVRLVNINTIEWLIYKGVKYIVE